MKAIFNIFHLIKMKGRERKRERERERGRERELSWKKVQIQT
jgi:hypothetical protein